MEPIQELLNQRHGIGASSNDAFKDGMGLVALNGFQIPIHHDPSCRLNQEERGGDIPFILWCNVNHSVNPSCGNKCQGIGNRTQEKAAIGGFPPRANRGAADRPGIHQEGPSVPGHAADLNGTAIQCW